MNRFVKLAAAVSGLLFGYTMGTIVNTNKKVTQLLKKSEEQSKETERLEKRYFEDMKSFIDTEGT